MASSRSDTVWYRFSWSVLPVPPAVTVVLDDGSKVQGPAIIQGPPKVEKVDRG